MFDPGPGGFLLLLGIPLAGAVLAALLRGRWSDLAALVASGAGALVGCALVASYGISGARVDLGGIPILDRVMGRSVPLFGFVLDPLSSTVLLGAVLIGFLCLLYSLAYVGPRNRETSVPDDRRAYSFWMLVFIAAMSGLVTSISLLQMFIFWEITTVCSWALIGFYDDEPHAQGAAQKAFLMTAGGGLCLFAALLAVLALTGSAGFDALGRLPGVVRAGGAMALVLLMCVGAWAKSAQVPFQTWLPSAMVAPSPVSAYLHAASMVNAGVYLVLRLALANAEASAGAMPTLLPQGIAAVVGGMAVLTLVVAVAQFFYQDDLKRLLALSTISHLALILLAAALAMAGSLRAAQGATLHVLAHGVGKALLFLSVGSLSYAAGTRRLSDLSGVLRQAPVASMGFLVGALTVTGVPPFAGFWSKLYMVTGAVQLGGWGVAAAAVIVLESVIAFAWFLWVGQRAFLGNPSSAVTAMGARASVMDTALIVLMVLCLAITLVALPLAQAVQPGGFGG